MLKPMLKNFLVKELTAFFECSEEALYAVGKRILIIFGFYLLGILVLFALSVGFAAAHSYFLMGVVGFLLWGSIFILCLILGTLSFLAAMYYGAYFARKGWER